MSALCRACGMCCDGTLFGRVVLEPDEIAAKRRLAIAEARFDQPCVALEGGACSIYDDRPRACRRFVCRLLEHHEREGDLEAHLRVVAHVRALLEQLPGSADELAQIIAQDFARV